MIKMIIIMMIIMMIIIQNSSDADKEIVRNFKYIEKGSRNLGLVVLACCREEISRQSFL